MRLRARVSGGRSASLNVLFPFTGWGLGGSHMSTFALAEALGRSGAANCAIIAPEGSPILQEAERRGLSTAPSGEGPLRQNGLDLGEIQRIARRTARLRASWRPGLVHCNDFRTLLAWSLPAKAGGAPVVYHHRGLRDLSAPKRAVFSSADHVITISDACTRNLDFIAPSRRTQIMNPITVADIGDVGKHRREVRARHEIPQDARVVGFMANFWTRKRPLLFLEAAALLAARDPSVWFVLFGRDADHTENELRAEADRLGVSARVRFPGFLPDPALNFSAIDLLAAPALDEPFGRTLVEAMLCGMPYVAAESAGHAEIHRRWGGGVLLRPEAPAETWADAIEDALKHGETLRLSSEAPEIVKTEVAPPRHAEAVAAIYRRLVG